MKQLLLAALLSIVFIQPALADCVEDLGQIDQALATNPSLSEQDMAQVRSLRADGEALCAAGQNDQATATLAQAKTILGL